MGDYSEDPSGFSFYIKKSFDDVKCNIEFNILSEWAGGCIGEIIISNITDKPIIDWTLDFTCDSQIYDIWNGSIVTKEGNRYHIENVGYNYIIDADASIKIGVNLAINDKNAIPSDFILTGK